MTVIQLFDGKDISYLIGIENANMDGYRRDRARITEDYAEATRFERNEALNMVKDIKEIYLNPGVTLIEE